MNTPATVTATHEELQSRFADHAINPGDQVTIVDQESMLYLVKTIDNHKLWLPVDMIETDKKPINT